MKSRAPSGERTVKKRLADGTVKVYTYAKDRQPSAPRYHPESLNSLIIAFRRSPEWRDKAAETKRQYSTYLEPLEKVGHLPARAITRRNIVDLRDAIAHASGNGAATGFIRVASVLFTWAIERERVAVNPASRVKVLKGGSLPAWTVAQAEHALAVMEEPLRRVVMLGIYTGQRRSDLCSLTWGSYDGASIRLTQGKTKVFLAIPVHPRLATSLARWKVEAAERAEAKGKTPPDHILTSLSGNPWTPAYLTLRMTRSLEKAGLPPGLNIHGLRKLAATMLAQAGCSTHEIAAITGHKTLSMVQHYTKSVDQERLATAAIARMQTVSANQDKPADN